jgi:tRNA pseudouridine55 synthase
MEKQSHFNFIEGETLLFDKDATWTSFDLVRKVRAEIRYALGIKKIKVGHGGTLDPLATGLMIVCTGKSTKKFDELIGLDKVYSGTIFLGATTPSYDLETEIDNNFDISHITEEQIQSLAKDFVGKQMQTPPIYSALKVKGQRLYEKARKGESVEIKKREVTIFKFDIDAISLPEITFTIHCSKGTYIRSVAHDFGKRLNSGAYLASLRRLKIGEFTLDNAWKIDEFVKNINSEK